MAQPKNQFDRKLKFLNSSDDTLLAYAVTIQNLMWRNIQPILDLFDDRILPNDTTVDLIGKLQTEAFRTYREETYRITDQVKTDFSTINYYTDAYFRNYSTDNPEGFQEGKDYSESLRVEQLGLASNGLLRDGFLNSYRQNPAVLNVLRVATFAAITTGLLKKTLINRLRKAILGDEKTSGVAEVQVNTTLIDTYNNFDSQTQKARAQRIGLRVAIYSNTIIQDSRCFCRNKFNKAWTIEEIADFEATTKTSETRSGAGCKAIYETTLYDPFVHRGGYNCRHVLRYVPRGTAVRFRPDLEEYYNDLDERGVNYL